MVNAAAAEEGGEVDEDKERAVDAADVPGALRGGALALARSAAFLVRWLRRCVCLLLWALGL